MPIYLLMSSGYFKSTDVRVSTSIPLTIKEILLYVHVWTELVEESCTCATSRVCLGLGAVFWRKRRGTSLWSHNWTKWLPLSDASLDSSPLLATIPTRWLSIDTKHLIMFFYGVRAKGPMLIRLSGHCLAACVLTIKGWLWSCVHATQGAYGPLTSSRTLLASTVRFWRAPSRNCNLRLRRRSHKGCDWSAH